MESAKKELAKQNPEQKEEKRFKVTDDDKACWTLKQIKECKEKIEQKEKLAERQIYQVKNWLEDETGKLKDSIEYFESLLYEYGLQLKKKDKDLKTHSLPFGDLKFRKQRPKWNYENDKLLKTAKNNMPDAVKIKEKVDKRTFKKLIKADGSPFKITNDGRVVNATTGEVLEGIKVAERGEKFQVKVK